MRTSKNNLKITLVNYNGQNGVAVLCLNCLIYNYRNKDYAEKSKPSERAGRKAKGAKINIDHVSPAAGVPRILKGKE